METRKYYAEDMPTAMEQIKRELGADAIIVKSRKIKQKTGPLGLFRKTIYEVVVSVDTEPPLPSRREELPNLSGLLGRMKPSRPETTEKARPAARQAEREPAPEAGKEAPPVEPERFAQLVRMSSRDTEHGADEDMLQVLTEAQVAPNPAAMTPATKLGAYAAVTGGNRRAPQKAAAPEPAFRAAPEPPAAAEEAQPAYARPRWQRVQEAEPQGAADTQKAKERAASDEDDEMLERLGALEQMVRKLTEQLAASPAVQAAPAPQPDVKLEVLIGRLEDQDVDREAIRALEAMARQRRDENPGETDYQLLSAALREMLGRPRYVRGAKSKPRIVMFMGPTGVGKTTTLVKIASTCVFERHAKAGIINADVFRVGAQDQLSAYARILDVPMATIYDTQEIVAVLEGFRDMDFVFIDTSGKAPHDPEYQAELRRLAELAGIQEMYLVISTTTASRVCRQIVQEYDKLGDYRIIATKLDESSTLGALVNLCHASGRPLSYMTTGQNVPDDIRKVEVDEIVEKLLR